MFETDCKAVVDAFHSHRIDQFEFGYLIKDCKTFFFKCQLIPSRFIKRQVNILTHIMTKTPCYNASPFYWLKTPRFIVKALIMDCS